MQVLDPYWLSLIPLENFELTADDELTLKGFMDLHVMTAADEEGGEGELWGILSSLGYSKQLALKTVSSYVRTYHT